MLFGFREQAFGGGPARRRGRGGASGLEDDAHDVPGGAAEEFPVGRGAEAAAIQFGVDFGFGGDAVVERLVEGEDEGRGNAGGAGEFGGAIGGRPEGATDFCEPRHRRVYQDVDPTLIHAFGLPAGILPEWDQAYAGMQPQVVSFCTQKSERIIQRTCEFLLKNNL